MPDSTVNDAVSLVERAGHPPYFVFPALEASGVAGHAFTTRRGGVSAPPYDSLNLGATTRDASGSVLENRRRMEAALGHPLREWVRLEHGNRVRVVRSEDAAGGERPAADAVVTAGRGIPLAIYYADCVPVVLLDPETPAVGLVHAGWRGTVAEVTRHAVEAMGDAFGSRPDRLLAGLGSSIGPCCFEVDADVTEMVRARFGRWQESVIRAKNKGKSTVDLWELNCLQLGEAGVPQQNVAVSRLCTSCRADLFYSFRRDRRVTGRLAMTVVLR